MDLAKYSPLNSVEQIDLLINDLLDNKIAVTNLVLLDNSVRIIIKKVKLQLYWIEKFNGISSRITVTPLQARTKPKSVSGKNESKPSKKKKKKEKAALKAEAKQKLVQKIKEHEENARKMLLSPSMVIGRSVREVSEKFKIAEELLILELSKSSSKDYQRETLGQKEFYLLKHFLYQNMEVKFPKSNYKPKFVYRAKIREKDKPSLGTPGNYYKLIYIRTKT